jgi:hypothetical protein
MGIDPLSTGLSLAGTIASLLGSNKQYKLSKEALAQQKVLTDRQVELSKYIQGLSTDLMSRGSTQVDPYGGAVGYDPATKTYKATLGGTQAGLQDLSDAEEAQRLGIDQTMRRSAVLDTERNRQLAGGEERRALDELGRFRQGIGAVDAGKLASQIRVNREAAINAGYDDAERAAQTLALRTGSSAAGDALTSLARDRLRARAAVGDPELDALTTAQSINTQRQGDIVGQYGAFADRGLQVPQAAFAPAPYAAEAAAKNADQMKFDLSKYDVAQGGSGTAASTIGSAAAGLRAAYTDALKTPNNLMNIGASLGALGNNKDITGSLMKLFG